MRWPSMAFITELPSCHEQCSDGVCRNVLCSLWNPRRRMLRMSRWLMHWFDCSGCDCGTCSVVHMSHTAQHKCSQVYALPL